MDELDAVLNSLDPLSQAQGVDELDAILNSLAPKSALRPIIPQASQREDLGAISMLAQDDPAAASMLAENMGYGRHPLTRAIQRQGPLPEPGPAQGVFLTPEERQQASDAIFGSQFGRIGAAAASGVVGFSAKFEADPTRTYEVQDEIHRRIAEGAQKAGYGKIARSVESMLTGAVENLVEGPCHRSSTPRWIRQEEPCTMRITWG
jgi:hypothetical protein